MVANEPHRRGLPLVSHFEYIDRRHIRSSPSMSPSKVPLPVGKLGRYLKRGTLVLSSRHPKQHLDPFSRFCSAHGRDQHTDKRRDRPRHSVCSNRPHLQYRCDVLPSVL